MTTIHDDDDDWEVRMGRMVSGMTCERDIDIALWYGLAASDLHDESVPQHDLHLREGRLGVRCEDLDARCGSTRLAILRLRHVLDDVVLEVIPSHPCVHVYTFPSAVPLLAYLIASAIAPCFH